METIERQGRTTLEPTKLPLIQNEQSSCNFNGYDADALMKETSKLRKLIKKGTLEILSPLCCKTNPVR